MSLHSTLDEQRFHVQWRCTKNKLYIETTKKWLYMKVFVLLRKSIPTCYLEIGFKVGVVVHQGIVHRGLSACSTAPKCQYCYWDR